MKFEHSEIFNLEGAIRGMRNPLASWKLSDSDYEEEEDYFCIGQKDMDLAKKLIKGGPEHRKFLRQIMVSVDITAPLFWFKEFDTYKVGTTANSTSTMHKLASTPITLDLFEIESLNAETIVYWTFIIESLEKLRVEYNQSGNRESWKALIELLPSAWLQTRTITMNYENLLSMYYQRKHHKLTEWRAFCLWVISLPYMSWFLESE